MARLMSVRFTEDAVRARTKTVTRRVGWWKDGRPLVTPGSELRLVRQAMGLRKGESITEIARVAVVHVRREPLRLILDDPAYGADEMAAEGFPGMDPGEFIARYFAPQRVNLHDRITRIEWRYLDGPERREIPS